MTGADLPLSGYAIIRVYVTSQSYEVVDGDDLPEMGEVSFSWDWRLLGEDDFEVLLGISVKASRARSDSFSVSAVGRFRRLEENPRIPLKDFVCLQAVAILLPYTRQFVSTLTGSSERGPYFLPVVDVSRLMKGMDPNQATGARALAALEKTSKRSVKTARQRPTH